VFLDIEPVFSIGTALKEAIAIKLGVQPLFSGRLWVQCSVRIELQPCDLMCC
jgi:hypothetical protein